VAASIACAISDVRLKKMGHKSRIPRIKLSITSVGVAETRPSLRPLLAPPRTLTTPLTLPAPILLPSNEGLLLLPAADAEADADEAVADVPRSVHAAYTPAVTKKAATHTKIARIAPRRIDGSTVASAATRPGSATEDSTHAVSCVELQSYTLSKPAGHAEQGAHTVSE
jgi:hypothetical protein